MKKILLVDDDKFLLKAYNIAFQNAGFETISLPDGTEVIETIKSESPDLVILDLVMPKKDGFEVLKELKSDEKLNKIPVVVLTQLETNEDKKTVEEIGYGDYLVKIDYELDEIVEYVKDKLK